MAFKAYKGYNFVDKDPIIDRLRTAYQDALGRDNKLNFSELSRRSGLSAATPHNWFDGDTKRPQFATVVAFARAIDCDVALVRKGAKGTEVVPVERKGSPMFNGRGGDAVRIVRRKLSEE